MPRDALMWSIIGADKSSRELAVFLLQDLLYYRKGMSKYTSDVANVTAMIDMLKMNAGNANK